ncbi:MAG: hybrid sensor histidine kinase/response regulator [Deltaproteobacteria bacterium]|nr:MAG: hybrid sensor histidine kinase/response regulator [Deltaproteobacteria bacterium]
MAKEIDSEISYKPRILVIDDEKRIRDGCQKVLAQEGFEVEKAETGEQGIKMIEERYYDIVLLDLMMPGLSGFEVLAHVKGIHPEAVIIVITGYATVEHSIEAMKKGAFDFIPKPFSPEQLRVIVSKAIEYTRTLQDIANEKSRMRVLINRLASGVMATDNLKRVALANPAFLKMVGHSGEKAIGLPIEECVRNERLKGMIDQALAMPKEEFVELTDELKIGQEREGEEIILSARCVPFRDRLGRNLGTITVLHDITALKKIDQLKSDLVSMVAHEVRNPMNSVLAQLKVVCDGLAGELTAKQKDILLRAAEKIKTLSDLTTELLDLAKIESGLIAQEKESVDLSSLLSQQVAFHQAKAEAKHIRLESDCPPDLPSVVANRANMEEVLSNLITNAIHYTPEGGRVTVSANIENDYFCIRVSDTGIGIPKEELSRIFDRFYRVKNEKTRFITGTGLGLPIVKSIVEAHNGRIKVESEPGKGSTFSAYLPLIS